MDFYEMSNDIATLKNLVFENKGDAPMFIYVQIFLDQNEKMFSSVESGPIRIDKEKIVVKEKESTTMRLRIDPDIVSSTETPEFIGQLNVYWGSELARGLLQKFGQNDTSIVKLPDFESDLQDDLMVFFKDSNELDFKQWSRVGYSQFSVTEIPKRLLLFILLFI